MFFKFENSYCFACFILNLNFFAVFLVDYFGCPSTKYEILAEIENISCSFNASSHFKSQVNVTFNMFLDLNGPDNLKLLKIKLFKDGASTAYEESLFTNPSGFTLRKKLFI